MWKLIEEEKAELMQAIGSIGVAISLSIFFATLPKDKLSWKFIYNNNILCWSTVAFVLFFIITIIGFIWSGKEKVELKKRYEKQINKIKSSHKEEIDQAQQKIQSLRIKLCKTLLEFSKEYLRQIWKEHFDSKQSLRITLYFHHGNYFYKAGRWSHNPKFVQQGRFKIPDTQGCLGQAWVHDGKNYSKNLSEISDEEICEKFNFSADEYKSLSMQSKLFEIRPVFSHSGDKIGLVVFETTSNKILLHDNRKDPSRVIDDIASKHNDFFVKIIEKLKPISLLTIYKEGGSDE